MISYLYLIIIITLIIHVHPFDINNIQLPRVFRSSVQQAADLDKLSDDTIRNAFITESVLYFRRILPRPTHDQYDAICKAFCDKYPSLKHSK